MGLSLDHRPILPFFSLLRIAHLNLTTFYRNIFYSLSAPSLSKRVQKREQLHCLTHDNMWRTRFQAGGGGVGVNETHRSKTICLFVYQSVICFTPNTGLLGEWLLWDSLSYSSLTMVVTLRDNDFQSFNVQW